MVRHIGATLNQFTPSLNLDFRGGVLPAALTFIRASQGTYFDSMGVMRTAAANEPRLDYDPSTLTIRGLLIEEQRTNLLAYSNDLANSAWTKNGFNVAQNATGLDAQTSAWTLTTTTTTPSGAGVRKSFSSAANTTYTASLYAKAGTTNFLEIQISDFSAHAKQIYVNLSTGAVTNGATNGSNVTYVSASARLVRDGFYRVEFIVTIANAATYFLEFHPATNTSNALTLNDTVFYHFGQLETGGYPTSYIPTTNAAATRAVDVCYMGLGSWYNFSQGSIYASFIPLTGLNNRGVFSLNDNSASNRIDFRSAGSNPFVSVGGTGQSVAYPPTGITVGVINKYAMSFSAGAFAIVGNGGGVATASPTAIPTNLSMLQVGNLDGLGSPQILNGYLRRLTYYPRRLPNTYLQALTQ